MFVIFGFGHVKAKKVGETHPMGCPNCNNVRSFDIVEQSKWFTLFFLPVFPYSKNKIMVCPICQRGKALENDEYERYMSGDVDHKEMVNEFEVKKEELENLYNEGHIDINEYKRRMNSLKYERTIS